MSSDTAAAAVVVNVKVAYLRPRYSNLADWIADCERNAYIGRGGVLFIDGKRYPSRSSLWANPFKVDARTTRAQVLQRYESYITARIAEQPETYDLESLRGKRLGCWCKPEACHGDVLLRLLLREKK